MKLKLAMTWTPLRFEAYVAWIAHLSPEIEVIPLKAGTDLTASLTEADGLLLTGGGDIHPTFFGASDPQGLSRSVDPARDQHEIEAVRLALQREIPILGICRGLQVVNVALGGTLVIDLPAAGFRDHSNKNNYQLAHPLSVCPGTQLAEIMQRPTLMVNTSHHQAIDRLGKGLAASAFSEDGVIEAAEWKERKGRAYLSLVQWHPEAMMNVPDPRASELLGAHFIEALFRKRASDSRGVSVL
jgi:putative glutamine amidotransferase